MKLYADEAGHRAIRALDALVISALARVEVPSALWRKARTGELEDAAASTLVSAFEFDFHGDLSSGSRFTIVSPTEPVLVVGARKAARHDQAVPAYPGSFVRRVANTPHYDGAKADAPEPAVIAVTGIGPVVQTWVDPSQTDPAEDLTRDGARWIQA